MRTEHKLICAGLLAVLGFANFLYAAIDRGTVQGTVTDDQGAAVPGAKVVVKNIDTNVEANLVTNSQGFYLAPELVPGKYTVSIGAPGFSRLEITNIIVSANITTTVDGNLKVGAVSERVEVSAEPALVESAPSNFTTP